MYLISLKPENSHRYEYKLLHEKEMEEKMGALELDLRNELEKKRDLSELDIMRKEFGELGGAGHYFGDDKKIKEGGPRNHMKEAELKKVIQLLSLGE